MNYDVLASVLQVLARRYAVHKTEIKVKDKKYPVIGRGATSIVLDYDKDRVLLYSRDRNKLLWLGHLYAIDLNDSHKLTGKIKELKHLHLFRVVVPRSYPLSTQNKRIVKDEIKKLDDIFYDLHPKKSNEISSRDGRPKLYDLSDAEHEKFNKEICKVYTEKYPRGLLVPLCRWLLEQNNLEFHWDLSLSNFMQNKQGHIIITDPIASKELLSFAFREDKYAKNIGDKK